MRKCNPCLDMILAVTGLIALLGGTLACSQTLRSKSEPFWKSPSQGITAVEEAIEATAVSWGLPTRRPPGAPIYTPTPDALHPLPPLRTDPALYIVQPGDTLGRIATSYGVSVKQIIGENELNNPNLLSVGQSLNIPPPQPRGTGPSFKIIPDSELVYGTASILFDTQHFIQEQGGYLASYREELGDTFLTGSQIVQSIAQDFSVNPRLLLAVLEHQSGWVTNPTPKDASQDFPMGFADTNRKGLYRQLAWAANNLNRGFYLWRVNGAAAWIMTDGDILRIDPTINAGTAAVQQLFAFLYGWKDWEHAVSSGGLFATYNHLFGYPFDYAIEPLLPPGLTQPHLQLPFEMGSQWVFTGGPHGAWGDGSAWGALDFAPPGNAVGCVQSDAWVVALADGIILRTGGGAVIQDLDGDGYEQTGWVALYMHIETRDRVAPGTYLKAGERIGHPSCEGGVSSGTHVHVARRYNGEWIPSDQGIPFVMDGWVSFGAGEQYDGTLQREGQIIEAYAGRSPDNIIQR